MKYTVLFMVLFLSATVGAHESDDPFITTVRVSQFEIREADNENPLILEGDVWVGYDLHKFGIKVDLEQPDEALEHVELQALYSRAISPYWNLQMGYRVDVEPAPDQDWFVLGLQGLAPYLFELDTSLFVGDENRIGLRMNAEYELLLTQQWILSPELEMNVYGQNDPPLETGSGLSDAEIGLRLRYEIRREFAPYLGISSKKWFGNAANYRRDGAEKTTATEWLIGVKAWY